ncbi:MAG: C40 family peptidase, partial [Clostridia bacterium]|nr:C40 family peptidase [Clostridia bacterium]
TEYVKAVVSYSFEKRPDTATITRADLEKALVEVAWAYFLKGSAIQYDSISLTSRTSQLANDPLGVYCNGISRMTLDASPENASSQLSNFTVCSGFCFDVYLEALGYPIFGNKMNTLTMTLWRNSSYPDDMAVLRWHSKGAGNKYNGYDDIYHISYENCWYEANEVLEFFQNYETTMRPGDIIVFDNPGHAVLYIGNGMTLDANGNKYKMTTGIDAWEADGTVDFNTVENKFLNPNDTNFYVGNLGWTENSICVVRPLNLLTVNDGDGDPSNDVLNTNYVLNTGDLKPKLNSDQTTVVKTSGYTIENDTYSRLAFPGMAIDRTVDITPFGTAVRGDVVTYTVAVYNGSANPYYKAYRSASTGKDYSGEDYQNLWIRETVPENTELVSAPGALVDGNTLRWEIDVPAGETVSVSYTVRVNGKIGDTIVCGGGRVDRIETNTIVNTIGGRKLQAQDLEERISVFFNDGTNVWNSNDGYRISASSDEGTHFAQRIYEEAFGLNSQSLGLPGIQEIMSLFFEDKEIQEPYGLYLYHDMAPLTRYLYSLKKESAEPGSVRSMLVNGYFGGVWAWSDSFGGEFRTKELREEYLELGDILVYMNLAASKSGGTELENRAVTEWRVIVYLGNGRYASLNSDGRLEALTDKTGLEAAFKYDLFVCLRPSQAYENVGETLGSFEGTPEALDDSDKRWEYVPQISDILLNEENSARLAAIRIGDYSWVKVNSPFLTEVYGK